MADLISRQRIAELSCHSVECSKCGATIGEPCHDQRGPMMGYHMTRHRELVSLKRDLRAFIRIHERARREGLTS